MYTLKRIDPHAIMLSKERHFDLKMAMVQHLTKKEIWTIVISYFFMMLESQICVASIQLLSVISIIQKVFAA